MKIKLLCLLIVVAFVADAEAGWKFWKKNKDDESNATSTTTETPPAVTPTTRRPSQTPDLNKALVGAADPGLAIGGGTTGTNVRSNARPSKPNPGTEVGLDIPLPKSPTSGQGYRDWAAQLTGAGEPGKPPQNPQQPALPNNKQLTPLPSPTTSTTTAKPPTQRPGTPTSNVSPNQPQRPGTPPGQSNRGPVSLSEIIGPQQPVQPTPKPAGQPGNNNGGGSKPSYAQIASGGSSPTNNGPQRPQYPTPAPTQRPVGSGAAAGAGLAAGAVAGSVVASNGKTYSSNPTYSKGNTVTDEDLEKLSEALFIKDSNNANKYITVNLQKQTTGSNIKDEAPQPLLKVNPEALQIPTVQRVLSIYDNYELDTKTNEYASPAERNEESLLVDTFLSTNVMSAAMRFIADKGYVRKDYYDYKDVLRKIWFNLFSRGEGKVGSAGFEHVFLSEERKEADKTEVLGLHNWIYFNSEESKNQLDYLGYIKKVDLGDKASIIKVHAKHHGYDKPVTTLFVGTSPELEMALYTVCFFTRQDKACPVSLGGTKFNIITYKFKYRGNDLIGTAYPDI